jgi:hypothetical protein
MFRKNFLIILLISLIFITFSCNHRYFEDTGTKAIDIEGNWKHYKMKPLGESLVGTVTFYNNGTFLQISVLGTEKEGDYTLIDDYLVMDYNTSGDFEGDVTEIPFCDCFFVDVVSGYDRKFLKTSYLE